MGMVTIASLKFTPGVQTLDAGYAMVRDDLVTRRFWTVELRDTEGRVGIGEAAPWPGSGVSSTDLGNATNIFEQHFLGQTIRLGDLLGHELQLPECSAAASHGLEQALLNLFAQQIDEPVERLLDRSPADEVSTHVLVHGAESAMAAVAAGIKTLKVKGSGELDLDDARLEAIRGAVPDAALRLDMNGAWNREQAAIALDRLSRHRLEWVEQPTPQDDLDSLAWLKARFPMAIAADESVIHHHEKLIADGLADVIVVKPMFLGGMVTAKTIAEGARRQGLQVCVTHALESPVGRRGALELAAALNLTETHGIAPMNLEAIVDGRVKLNGGML